ncbi:MAG: ATP-binding protein [Candidatus Improbicoccus pseudotrichonymphae]|uniref:ATP-binding protein n=1 Tax=Candidatus Improbicoccus pseudotrichonymphae TaxID=3033792 RepID=A0AA48HVR7_9FIRM|nr:MAG: ATP-binding protein [Candidatus Improbicoccus pseudotrichonymphae]
MLDLVFDAKTSNWDKLYNRLHDFFLSLKISEDKIERICIACEEVFVNICNYAYQNCRDDTKKDVKIKSEYENNILSITFIDNGVEFNPLDFKKNKIEKKGVEKMKIGGYGIYLVNKIMDNIKYERKDDKNYFYIYKKINSNRE